jgi:ribokinase
MFFFLNENGLSCALSHSAIIKNLPEDYQMNNILVIGSINMDVVNFVERYPLPGETIKGLKTEYMPGGKGANQAVAASLAGASVTILGGIGQDVFGSELLESIRHAGIGTDSILIKEGSSGLAFITVDSNGENEIILSEGSNGKLSVQDIQNSLILIKKSNVIVLQNEIPMETTYYALKEAKRNGIHVCFNPAPAFKVTTDLLLLVDTIILNETEAEVMTGLKILEEKQVIEAANYLIHEGVSNVIITRGVKGSTFLDKQGALIHMPAFHVPTVDTTAAGDTFIGAYIASTFSRNIEESLRFASAAAALTVSRKGAQKSIPSREEILNFLKLYS